MLFIETEIFTEDVQKLLNDDEFSRFQFFLALNPDYGEVIPETGGLRKVRCLRRKGETCWCQGYLLSSG